MTVSVLVVTNRPEHIPWWMHQIHKQTRQPDEVIVVDNRKDMTAPWLAGGCQGQLGNSEDPNGPFFFAKHMPPETSLGELRQAALDLARHDVILWFDDDDWYHPRRIELSAAPIESGRYDLAVFPLTHYHYVKERLVHDYPGGAGPHLPASAWRREVARRVAFQPLNAGEDHHWIHTQVHPLDGSAPQIAPQRVRWIPDYGLPNFGGIVMIHAKNSWQTPLEKVADPAGTLSPLPRYAPKGVLQDVWNEDLQLLEQMRAAHYA